MAKTRKVEVHVTFSDTVRKGNRQICSIDITSDGSDSVWDIKTRIAVGAASLTVRMALVYHNTQPMLMEERSVKHR